MAITKEQAIDILDKFDFFEGQRAGRELWNDKPYEVQEEDINNFSRDVAELKAYIADVVPKSEADNWYQLYHSIKEELKQEKMYHRETDKLCDRYYIESQQAKRQVAREIFEEIEKIACVYKLDGDFYLDSGLYAELKNKYAEDKK